MDFAEEAEKEVDIHFDTIPGGLAMLMFFVSVVSLAATTIPPETVFPDRVTESWLGIVASLFTWVRGWIPVYWIWPTLLCLSETVLLYGILRGMTRYRYPFTKLIFLMMLLNVATFALPYLLRGVVDGETVATATVTCQAVTLLVQFLLGRGMAGVYEKGLKEFGDTLRNCAVILLVLFVVKLGGPFVLGPVAYGYILTVVSALNFLVAGYLLMTFMSTLIPSTNEIEN